MITMWKVAQNQPALYPEKHSTKNVCSGTIEVPQRIHIFMLFTV